MTVVSSALGSSVHLLLLAAAMVALGGCSRGTEPVAAPAPSPSLSATPAEEERTQAEASVDPSPEDDYDTSGATPVLPRIDGHEPEPGFVRIPAGTFVMGSAATEVGREACETQHSVTLTRAFHMSRYQTTQAEYEGLMGWNPSQHRGDIRPVDHISWFDAVAYANEMSRRDELKPCYALSEVTCADGTAVDTDYRGCASPARGGIDAAQVGVAGDALSVLECEGYRLPTEAEWEYAARSAGEVTDAFPNGGNLKAGSQSSCEPQLLLDDGKPLGDQCCFCGSCSGVPHPVGTLPPNAIGLYETSGNIWEWCHDWFGEYTVDATDPVGPPSGLGRVARGSSWAYTPDRARLASRNHFEPGYHYVSLGIRIVRTDQKGKRGSDIDY